MGHFTILLTTLAMILSVNVVSSQEPADSVKKPPAAEETQDKAAKTAVIADGGATDPGTPGGDPAEAGSANATDTDAIGALLLDDNPKADPAEAGRRMVIQGLGLQVGALAAKIRSTEDAKAKEQMMAELRSTVKIAVELRKKYRQARIARLEKLIARLRKEAEADSVDAIVKQLLTSATSASATDPGSAGDDPAADASGTDDTATSPTDPSSDTDDPAEAKKAKQDKGQDDS